MSLGLCLVSCEKDNEEVTPVQVVTGLSFADTDPVEGKIGGVLTWDTPTSADNITKYVIYLSPDGKVKESGLGEVNAGTSSFTIPSGTDLAAYIIVVAANAAGESEAFAGLKLTDTVNEPAPPVEVNAVYFLNNGKIESNNAGITLYNPGESTVVDANYFNTANNRGLGDTGQDIIVYGNKMYIAVFGSGVIEVTDLKGISIKQIKSSDPGKPLQPRALVSDKGNVYVSLYDGFVAKIDTASLEITGKVAVGRNPEYMAVAGDRLYVANSGGLGWSSPEGYDKTVSVIDIPGFTETKKIEVMLNPVGLVADSQGDVYVVSMGNYGDVPNTLQRIDATTHEVEVMMNVTELSIMNDKLYMYYSQWDWSTNTGTITWYCYDALKEEVVTDQFIAGGIIAQPYKLFTLPASGQVCVTESDFVNNGDVYIFTEDGELVDKAEAGLNPMKGVEVTYLETAYNE